MSTTAVLVTHNSADMLDKCLDTLNWADEILVLDKKSTDNTLEIAEQHRCKIIKYEGERFDDWRNLGIYHASSDWIFYIDPDERVTEALQHEIAEVVSGEWLKHQDNHTQPVAFRLSRKNYWWGKEFIACGASPDYVTRLFKRNNLKKWFGVIHESPEVEGEIGTLKTPLIHYTHRDLITGLGKSYQWTRMEAELFHQAGHPAVTWWRLVKITLEAFFKKFIAQKGFTHGTEGFIESAVQAWNRFMVYEQLWELQQQPSLDEKYKQLDK